jgi:hypothetical protein
MTRDLVDMMGGGKGRAPHRLSDDDDTVQKSDLSDYDFALIYQTDDAILVSETGDESKAIWLPKSHIEMHRDGKTTQGIRKDGQKTTWPLVTVTIPEWLAKEKGLI